MAIQNFLLTVTASNPFTDVAKPIINLINMLIGPALGIVAALGAIYCIILGVKLAKAEEQQDREKAKNSLKNALIGFVLIFVLIMALNVGMGTMTNWVNSNASGVKLDYQKNN